MANLTITRIEIGDQTRLVDSRSRYNSLIEKMVSAKHGEKPIENNRELSTRTVLLDLKRRQPQRNAGNSADVPRKFYGTPAEFVPTHGAKHTKIRYREDWNADGSGWSDVHDLIAGTFSGDADDYATVIDAARVSANGEDKFDKPITQKLVDCVADRHISTSEIASAVVPDHIRARTVEIAGPSKRELMQRMSRKQRRIFHAFQLWGTGLTWREVAKKMGEPEHVVYGWYRAIRSKIGRAATSRRVDLPRDENNRFVGCSKTSKK
jgi:hypothetical protein